MHLYFVQRSGLLKNYELTKCITSFNWIKSQRVNQVNKLKNFHKHQDQTKRNRI